MYDTTNTPSAGTFSNVKLPSKSVIVPFVVPFTITFAPITGIPAPSTTTPVTFLPCCTTDTSPLSSVETGTAIAVFTEKAENSKQNTDAFAILSKDNGLDSFFVISLLN